MTAQSSPERTSPTRPATSLFSAGIEGQNLTKHHAVIPGDFVYHHWQTHDGPLVMDGEAVWMHWTGDREATEDYVTQVYSDLFNRAPDDAGLDAWTVALQDGVPYGDVANGITYSDEYRATLIRESYQAYLGREPAPSGAAGWLAAMRSGTTIQAMEAGFIASDEYHAQAGGTNAAWVQALYSRRAGPRCG